MIELHSMPTPNGQKIMIMLEEAGVEWQHVDVDIRLGEQFSAAHLALSPNNKIPTIVDDDGPGGGRYSLMESGAILIYLAEKTRQFLPQDARKRYDTLQWLMFQMAHIGPMFGQANHFNKYAKQDIAYAKDRYNNEVLRLCRVLDVRLRQSAWLGCDEYTIADMATYPWVKEQKEYAIDRGRFPHVRRWYETLEARPAMRRVNQMVIDVRARMDAAASGKEPINMFDTKDNAERLARATAHRID